MILVDTERTKTRDLENGFRTHPRLLDFGRFHSDWASQRIAPVELIYLGPDVDVRHLFAFVGRRRVTPTNALGGNGSSNARCARP